jgi:hypothetical protein
VVSPEEFRERRLLRYGTVGSRIARAPIEEELSPKDAAALDALMADVERELVRVDVDWADAAPEDDGWEPVLGLDATGLLAVLRPLLNGAVLRTLPDGAGTARFLAAFRERELGQLPPTAGTT